MDELSMERSEIFSRYDSYMEGKGTYVLVGDCAINRSGLTTTWSSVLWMGTLCPSINGCGSLFFSYYFSPWADKYFDCTPSPKCSGILVPTQERALVETMLLHEQFSEGILIEGIQTYLLKNGGDYSGLIDMSKKFIGDAGIPIVEYWVKEAKEDDYTCG